MSKKYGYRCATCTKEKIKHRTVRGRMIVPSRSCAECQGFTQSRVDGVRLEGNLIVKTLAPSMPLGY